MSIPEETEREWKRNIAENIDKGESVYAVYKGEALQRLSGKMSDEEALVLGHYDGLTNVTLNTIKTTEDGLNKLGTLQAELVPVKKKTSKGIVWIEDDEEAKAEAEKERLDIRKIKGKWYFEYPGIKIKDRIMTNFIYNIARSSGSLGGETKVKGFEALAQVQAPPQFPTMQSMRPMPELYGADSDYKDKDAD